MKTPVSDIGEERFLLACAQAGDERAFRRLVEPYRRALEVHCYRMLGSAQDAEDMAQETLLRAWRALERFEPRVQFQTWLYRIATNACLDELERRPRRAEPIDPFPDRRLDEAASPIYDPAARYAIREGMELALLRAIQELPGRQRAVLIFRDVLRETAAGGDLARMRLTPTRANGRAAVAVQRRSLDGGLVPHGVLLLQTDGEAIAEIDAFIDPRLLPLFGLSGSSP